MISVYMDEDEWHVWIETDEGLKDGLILGVGGTRELALREAKQEFKRLFKALERLQSAYHRIAAA